MESLKQALDLYNITHMYVGAITRQESRVNHFQPHKTPKLWYLMYKNIWEWVDGRHAFVTINVKNVYREMCALLVKTNDSVYLNAVSCHQSYHVQRLCMEKPLPLCANSQIPKEKVMLSPAPSAMFSPSKFKFCPEGHYVRNFMPCHKRDGSTFSRICYKDMSPLMCFSDNIWFVRCKTIYNYKMFLPYFLACDHIDHCEKKLTQEMSTDEKQCVYEKCPKNMFTCRSHQCVEMSAFCDGVYHCYDGSDEECVRPVERVRDVFQRCAVTRLYTHIQQMHVHI